MPQGLALWRFTIFAEICIILYDCEISVRLKKPFIGYSKNSFLFTLSNIYKVHFI